MAFLVTSAFFLAYFFLALPSAAILQKIGYKNGMALGLGVMVLGALLFIPAAHARNFPLFLVALFIQASGMSLMQTAANPYISILGPLNSAARRMSIMGICNKTAGGVAPLILGALVLKNAQALNTQIQATTDPALKETLLSELAGRIVPMYIVIAVVLGILALMIKASSLPEIQMGAEDDKADGSQTRRSVVFQYPHLSPWSLGASSFMWALKFWRVTALAHFRKGSGHQPMDKTKYFHHLHPWQPCCWDTSAGSS